jgi:predicted DsbA family dithiol-disulfide isomerase
MTDSKSAKRGKIAIDYYSDVLCVWAYLAQIKLDELRRNFGEQIAVRDRYVPVFGSIEAKLRGWKDRGGAAGYARHVHEVARGFDHVQMHPAAWSDVSPPSSLGIHLFITAARLAGEDAAIGGRSLPFPEGRSLSEELAWRLRLAFFKDGLDIARTEIQEQIAAELGLPLEELRCRVDDGRAYAALSEDYQDAERLGIQGSPTFVLNEGRQKLYGNVGYRIIEVNVQELLRDNSDKASWC